VIVESLSQFVKSILEKLLKSRAPVAYTSTRFVGWSPDGRVAVVGRGWESAENGKWEEEHYPFRFDASGYLYDRVRVMPLVCSGAYSTPSR
jgi:hypothetical protein